MKMNKKLSAMLQEAQATDGYWVEKAKLDFAVGLDKQRRAKGLSYAAVADLLKTSAAYISKVFRGDTNVTIETMVKLARATGGELVIEINEPVAKDVKWALDRAKAPASTTAHQTRTATIYTLPQAANADEFAVWNVA